MENVERRPSVQFGRVLEKETGGKKIWLLIVPVIVGLVALVVFAGNALSKADGLAREVDAAKAQVADQQKALDERDKLLVKERADEGVLKSPGQASAIFYAVGKGAVESGIAFAHPDAKAVKVYLYGLQQPPAGQEYAVAARRADGTLAPLGVVVPGSNGDGFLLSREVPEGTTAIELVLRPADAKDASGATPRIAARYPAAPDERGVLVQPPAKGAGPVQARRGAAPARR